MEDASKRGCTLIETCLAAKPKSFRFDTETNPLHTLRQYWRENKAVEASTSHNRETALRTSQGQTKIYITTTSSTMSDLFETQNEVTRNGRLQYAQNLVRSSVNRMPWQGYHSYTFLSESGFIVQFRSEKSPLDISMTTLAKGIQRHIAPATLYQGLMPNRSVSIWIMEALPGVGQLSTVSDTTEAK